MKRAFASFAVSSMLVAACAAKPPPPAPPPPPTPIPVASESAPPPAPTTPDDDFRKTPPAIAARPPLVPPVVDDTKLSNGVRVAVLERHATPVVSVEVTIVRANGSTAAGRDLLGALLLTSTSTGGASAKAVLDQLGSASIAESGLDGNRIAITTTPEALDRVLAVLADVLTKHAMSKDAFPAQLETMRGRANRAQRVDEIHAFAADAILPAGHPYRTPVHADVAATHRLTFDEATRAAQLAIQPDAVTILLVGDVSKKDVTDKLEAKLSSWKGKAPPAPAKVSDKLAKGVFLGQVKDATGAELAVVAPAVPRSSHDYAAVLLLQDLLLSDLWRGLDGVRSWSGVEATVLEANAYPGLWMNVVEVENDAIPAACEHLLAMVERLRQGEFSDAKLEEVRAAKVRQIEDNMDTSPNTALLLSTELTERVAADDVAKLHDRLLSLSKEDLKAAAQTYLKKEELRLVAVGDVTPQRKQLEALKLGPITTRTITRPPHEPVGLTGVGVLGVLGSGTLTGADVGTVFGSGGLGLGGVGTGTAPKPKQPKKK